MLTSLERKILSQTTYETQKRDVLSLLLFVTMMDDIIKECAQEMKNLHRGCKKLQKIGIVKCAFVDDVVVLAVKEKQLQHNLHV